MQDTHESAPVPAAACPGPRPPCTGPDWAAITHDVFCPLCEYNLRGLIEPRCPECGYRFDWPEVLDPQRGLHPYLFEHHPERNWWSYWRTAWGARRPKSFWLSLHPTQPSRPRRAVLYGFVGASLLLCMHLLFLAANLAYEMRLAGIERTRAFHFLQADPTARQKVAAGFGGSVDAYLDFCYPVGLPYLKRRLADTSDLRQQWLRVLLIGVAAPLVWASLSVAALMLFQISMRRGRLKPIHLTRSVLYSFDPPFWLVLFLLGCVLTSLFSIVNNPGSAFAGFGFLDGRFPPWIVPAIGLSAWRMQAACKLYLRFTWPTGTVLATQIIALLGVMIFLVVFDFEVAYTLYRMAGLAY